MSSNSSRRTEDNRPWHRREFLRSTVATGAAWTLAANAGTAAQQRDTIRLGFVGVGGRGTYLLTQFLRVEGVEVTAVCDLAEDRVAHAQQLVEQAGQPKPQGYYGGPMEYRRLCEQADVDAVVNATPWQAHTPINLAALAAGKHVATEVPGALSVDECWQQVEAAEKAARQCMILENYCYQRDVMLVMNLIRQGLFGQVMHAEGGYQKDARYYDVQVQPGDQLSWQGQFRKDRKGNIYPTHDIGPISWWMDINRGDRFEYLVSIGSPAVAMNEYGADYFGPDHFLTKTKWNMSDINVSLLKTVKGRSVYLILDTLLSRPQPRNVYRLLGSKGIYDRTINALYLEAKSPRHDRWHGDWEPVDKYFEDYEHPLWKDLREKARTSGHGGGDFLMVYRAVQALQANTTPDIDVCVMATWSSIVGLSEQSARKGSSPVEFPDFTRGKWENRQPLAIRGA